MDYTTFVAVIAEQPPYGHRYGQFVFNSLYVARPDLANRIRATDLDPYHNDAAVPELLEWLAANWYDVAGVDAV